MPYNELTGKTWIKSRKKGETTKFFVEQLAIDLCIRKEEALLILDAIGRCAQLCLLEDRAVIFPNAFVISMLQDGQYIRGSEPIKCVLCPQLRELLKMNKASKMEEKKKATAACQPAEHDVSPIPEDQML